MSLTLDVEKTGNLVEAGFWISFGLVVLLGLCKRARRVTAFTIITAAIIVLFGVSDLVEAQTGAWWRPWWLLVWKADCLAGMALCLWTFLRVRSEPG